MNYHLRSRRGSRENLRKAIFLGIIFVAGFVIFSLFDNAIIRAVSPVWKAENGFSRNIAKFIDYFHTKNSLVNENAALKEEVNSLRLTAATLAQEREELRNLQALLGRTVDKNSIGATILTRPPQSPYDLVVVDAGGRDGVVVGSKVTLPDGPEIGSVSEVFPTFSKVKLLSTSGLKSDAVFERHEVPVTLEGEGGGNFKIVVPRETEVVVGDRVLSPGLDARLVAVVEDIKVTPTDSFKEVWAKGPANIFSLRNVSIIK